MAAVEVGLELSDGPLRSGLSNSTTSFIQFSPDGKIDFGASYSESDSSRGAG